MIDIDCLVKYNENDTFKTINNEKIMQWFQNIKTHRGKLNKLILDVTLNCKLHLYVLNKN
jgi:hypothetical protein